MQHSLKKEYERKITNFHEELERLRQYLSDFGLQGRIEDARWWRWHERLAVLDRTCGDLEVIAWLSNNSSGFGFLNAEINYLPTSAERAAKVLIRLSEYQI